MVQSHPAEAGHRKRQRRMAIESQSTILPDMPAWLVTGSHLKKLPEEKTSNKEHCKHSIPMMHIPEYLNLLACRKREFFKAKYSRGRLKGLREIREIIGLFFEVKSI